MQALPLKLISFVSVTGVVSGHYCEWDLCDSEQYCCGDNLCCDYVYSLWYFWVGVVFLVLLLSACGGLFRYYYRRWYTEGSGLPYIPFPASPAYSSLPTHISNQEPLFQITDDGKKTEMWVTSSAIVFPPDLKFTSSHGRMHHKNGRIRRGVLLAVYWQVCYWICHINFVLGDLKIFMLWILCILIQAHYKREMRNNLCS